MKLTEKLLPPGYRFRELWLPELISGSSLLRSVHGGHNLTLTGARKGSTANGVHGDGNLATSLINCGVLYNGVTTLATSFRFKLDQAYLAGIGYDCVLWCKKDNGNSLQLVLTQGTGKMQFRRLGGVGFILETTQTSWSAGWYHVLASISAANKVRLRINNGAAVTDPAATSAPAAGNFEIAGCVALGWGGLRGVIADFVVVTDDLTTTEETELYKGILPSDNVVNFWPLDEGRGLTAYDRGAGVNNGTLGAACKWDFDARKLAALSLSGIDGHADSPSGVDISGDLTLIWVGKIKNTQDTALADSCIALFRVGANDYLKLLHANGTDGLAFIASGGGTSQTLNHAAESVIDDYMIVIATLTLAGAAQLFINGSLVDTATGVGAVSGLAATAYLGATNVPDQYNLNKPLLAGLIDGALSVGDAKQLARVINKSMGLGLSI